MLKVGTGLNALLNQNIEAMILMELG